MFGGDRDLDTICAISTPAGTGGIHVVRVCGPQALKVAQQSCKFLPASPESHRVYFGTLSWESDGSDPIDEVLVTYFKRGKSYSGDETIEISCHGSPFIASRVLSALLQHGARLADKGEFTYRAFINGKLDLVQAESVLSLIQSESKKAAEISLRQLKGGLSEELKKIEGSTLALLARLEISIDFTTEDIEIIASGEILERLKSITGPISKLLESFKLGRKIHAGFDVALVGEPNVGKSSLLNRVLAEDRAIVTDVPGTTRDLIQEKISVNGVAVSIIDSAGIRETSDIVEKIGVDRSKVLVRSADLVLALFDCTNPRFESLIEFLPEDLSKTVFIGNKVDLVSVEKTQSLKAELSEKLCKYKYFRSESEVQTFLKSHCQFLSTLAPETENAVVELIGSHLDTSHFGDESILSQTRHFENLQRAHECLERASSLSLAGSSPEFLALELKETLIRIQEILGERFDDQILDRVFGEFCIGK